MSTEMLPLNHPRYIDPLYRPYHTDYSKSQWRFPHVIDTKYPLVDPYRRHLGWGNTYRSQHEGICQPGWRIGKHNHCVPLEPESWGMFATDEYVNTPLEYSHGKIPYNANLCNDNSYLVANGYDNANVTDVARCHNANFW